MKASECLRHHWNCVALILHPFQLKAATEGSVYTMKATVRATKNQPL